MFWLRLVAIAVSLGGAGWWHYTTFTRPQNELAQCKAAFATSDAARRAAVTARDDAEAIMATLAEECNARVDALQTQCKRKDAAANQRAQAILAKPRALPKSAGAEAMNRLMGELYEQ